MNFPVQSAGRCVLSIGAINLVEVEILSDDVVQIDFGDEYLWIVSGNVRAVRVDSKKTKMPVAAFDFSDDIALHETVEFVRRRD